MNSLKRMSYYGTSMNPTLRVPDAIGVALYCNREVLVGDVIVFHCKIKDKQVVHRVVAIRESQLITRGDNCPLSDPPISRSQVIGKVICAWRGKKRRTIHGGLAGHLWSLTIAPAHRALSRTKRSLGRLLDPIYSWVAESGIARNIYSIDHRIRIIQIQHPQGTELHLLKGKSVIGRLLPKEGSWKIRKPYRLFFDERQLPVASHLEMADGHPDVED